MTKDSTNFHINQDSVKDICEVVLDKEVYQTLLSTKSISFRKQMADKLDKIFIPSPGWTTWKKRFLSPETIPGKHAAQISQVMADGLIWALQEQIDYLNDQKKDIEDLLVKTYFILNKYKSHEQETIA